MLINFITQKKKKKKKIYIYNDIYQNVHHELLIFVNTKRGIQTTPIETKCH